MIVAVGSTNPAKLRAVQDVVGAVWPGSEVGGVAASSGVSEQPLTLAQTRRGAVNRARAALRLLPGAALGVGLEGGVRFEGGGLERCLLFGVVAVTDGARLELGRTAELRLPPGVAVRLRAGEELGPLMDELSGIQDSKRKAGTVGFLTNGHLSRSDIWQQALMLALAPLLRTELYGEPPPG